MHRLQQITASVLAQPVAGLSPVPCASLAEIEGEAVARYERLKICILGVGIGHQGTRLRGVPLAAKADVEAAFRKKGFACKWAGSVEEIPEDIEIIVTTGAFLGSDVLIKLKKLRLVAVAYTGFDHVDVECCQQMGVKVVNVPDYSTDATAELAIGLIISHLRRFQQLHDSVADGTWTSAPQEELQSKKVGIIGTGKIGMRLTELFAAFKVKEILAYSLIQNADFQKLGGIYVPQLSKLFLEADIICVCVPLDENSRGLISDQLMSLLRPDCLLVNVARGGVVDEKALAKFLEHGNFRAALDVFETEPLPTNHPLSRVPLDTLLMTPHVGYQSAGSLARRFDITLKNILAFAAGQPMNVVA